MRMRKFSLLILIAIISSVSLAAFGQGKGADARMVKQLPSKEKRWALIVGVSNYEDGNITDLKGANDARVLKEALVRYAGFPESQVVLLTTDEPRERQPTRENIIKRLSILKALVPRDGLFLFSFSGHGIENSGEAFLIPSSMSYDDDIDVLKETAVSVEYVRRQIKLMSIQQVLILLDVCRNDPANSRSDSTNPLTTAYTKGFNFDVQNKEVLAFATLYATSVGQRAYEYSEKGLGYFTWAVVEGLKGAAANERGEVTLYGLKRFIEETVPRAVRLSLKKVQQPFAVIDGYMGEDLVVAVRVDAGPPAVPQINTQRDRDWALVDKQSRAELELFLAKYKDDLEATLTLRRLEEKELRAGQVMTVKLNDTVRMSFVYVPPGSFKMGVGNEAHTVTINRGFWLGQTEVTQEQWDSIMVKYVDWGSKKISVKSERLVDGPNLPINTVSWVNTQSFIKDLNELQSTYTFRLPTEAEWEYAARAGTIEDKVANLDSVAWYYANSGEKRLDRRNYQNLADALLASEANKNRPHPVKEKAPNNWGLYDMYGNVLEWVNSKYMPYPYKLNDGRESQSGEGTKRVARGGSYSDTLNVSPVYRSDAEADTKYSNFGFRLVVSPR